MLRGMPDLRALCGVAALAALAACAPIPAQSQGRASIPVELPPEQAPTYADLVSLAESGPVVAIASIAEQIPLPPERAPGLPPGQVRLYLEARLTALLAAPGPLGESLAFLVDRPLDARGRPPVLERGSFLLFASPVPGQPGFVQLENSDSLLPAGPLLEARVRRVLTQLSAADSPPPVTGVGDVIHVPGNLAGESETQMSLATTAGAPLSLSVIRRPGMAPSWGISLGEIVDPDARPPEPETIAWYRLACQLPPVLPAGSFLQADRESRIRASADYALVREQLGPCERRLAPPPAL